MDHGQHRGLYMQLSHLPWLSKAEFSNALPFAFVLAKHSWHPMLCNHIITASQAAKNASCMREKGLSVIKLKPRKSQATAVANLGSAPAYCFE